MSERLSDEALSYFQFVTANLDAAQAAHRSYILHLCRQHGLRPGVDDITDDGTIVRMVAQPPPDPNVHESQLERTRKAEEPPVSANGHVAADELVPALSASAPESPL